MIPDVRTAAGGAKAAFPPPQAGITAKVASSRYSNVLAAGDTLFSHGATTGFPYNCALSELLALPRPFERSAV